MSARIKGIFKIDGITSTNPIAVGDEVEIDVESETAKTAIITQIYPRRNYINRQSPAHKHHHHIVAANIDQSLMFATLKDPKTSQGFIDRFLVTSEAYHVPAIVVFNKADLYKNKELEKYATLNEVYTAIGYKTVLMSIKTSAGVEEVRDLLKGKTTLLSGHSGVGKSSFITVSYTHLTLPTKRIV